MKKHIGKYVSVTLLFTLPVVTFAQTYMTDTWQTLIANDSNSKLLAIVSLFAMLTVAFATSIMVWISGRKMHGGVFGKVLNFFSIGMMLVFLGLVSEMSYFQSFDQLYMKMTHDSLFIIGYILMGLGVNKLLEAIKGE